MKTDRVAEIQYSAGRLTDSPLASSNVSVSFSPDSVPNFLAVRRWRFFSAFKSRQKRNPDGIHVKRDDHCDTARRWSRNGRLRTRGGRTPVHVASDIQLLITNQRDESVSYGRHRVVNEDEGNGDFFFFKTRARYVTTFDRGRSAGACARARRRVFLCSGEKRVKNDSDDSDGENIIYIFGVHGFSVNREKHTT